VPLSEQLTDIASRVVGFSSSTRSPGLQMSDSTIVNMLKDYMESGSFNRGGKEEIPAEASVVLIGNTSKPHEELVRTAHLFADLPPAMIDPAFLDRIHYYLPGWETPKLEGRHFTDHFGFVSDYFAEALRQLRKRSYVTALDADFTLGSHLSARDEKAVRKTVSGLLKILHPHGEWSHGELREYLEYAIEGRRRVKEQLKKLAAHDYAKTAFSYVENDTGRETWVELPEQPDVFDAGEIVEQASTGASEARTTSDLIEQGESKTVEFKQTARLNAHTGTKDRKLEDAVVKSIAGFLNAGGGILLIGVSDDQEVTGVECDYPLMGKPDRDGFENWLTTRLIDDLGKNETASFVRIVFENIGGHEVCRVNVEPCNKPVYVGKDATFYVRVGNSTRACNPRETMEYVKDRWGSR